MSYRRITYELSKTGLRMPLAWLRHRGLDETDVAIASFPRSGNTWFRFLLTETLTGGATEFDDIRVAVPHVGLHRLAPALLPDGGRLLKSHEPYRREYKKAIYLVRDVRDIVLSLYSRGKYLEVFTGTFDDFLPAFLEGKHSNIGSWQAHVRGWMHSPLAGRGKLLVIRFEDLRHDTESVLQRAIDFLGVAVDPGTIRTAVAGNSLEKMRLKEDRTDKLPKSAEESGRFVRKGAVQGWRGQLSDEQIALVDQYAGPELELLGYARSSQTQLAC